MSRKWTLEEDNALIEMKEQGMTYDTISQRLCRSVKSLCDRYFVIRNNKLNPYDPELVDKIRYMTEKGISCREISPAVGIPEWKVGEIRRYFGMAKGKPMQNLKRIVRREDDSICWHCKNTHKDKCTWFNPDNQEFPDNVKVIVRKNLQPKTKKNNDYLFKIVSCPNFVKMEDELDE